MPPGIFVTPEQQLAARTYLVQLMMHNYVMAFNINLMLDSGFYPADQEEAAYQMAVNAMARANEIATVLGAGVGVLTNGALV